MVDRGAIHRLFAPVIARASQNYSNKNSNLSFQLQMACEIQKFETRDKTGSYIFMPLYSILMLGLRIPYKSIKMSLLFY